MKSIIYLFILLILGCKIPEKNMTTKLKFTTSYSQFYVVDSQNDNHTNDDLLDSDIEARLFNNSSFFVSIFTKSYGHIKGELTILDKVNETYNPDLYDHIVESSIDIPSGILQVLDCPFSTVILEKKAPSGKYRIRVYFSNLDSVIDPDIRAKDYYKIEMWRDSSTLGRKVIKWYLPDIDE